MMRHLWIYALVVGLTLVMAQVAFADSTYVVQPGDNLTKIAKRFGVTVDSLVKVNRLSSANAIRIGQTLTIPDGTPVAPRADLTYTVQRGDSLARIATRFKVSIDALVVVNNLKIKVLQIGQTLIIPGQAPVSVNPPAPVLPRPTSLPAEPGVTVLAAGDIAYCGSEHDEATADILDQHAGLVLALGDNVYDAGTAAEFTNCYGPSWGGIKSAPAPPLAIMNM